MACSKAAYPSEKIAKEIVGSIHRNPGRKGKTKIPKRVYWCKDCRMYHITSASDGLTKRKRRE